MRKNRFPFYLRIQPCRELKSTSINESTQSRFAAWQEYASVSASQRGKNIHDISYATLPCEVMNQISHASQRGKNIHQLVYQRIK